ncbi:hypothetical protein DB345_20960 [Spartobacteria bacterium LR76]|nr:hypothetical protein DB345_20960 [Spartobacteria bacterium LR76]
MKFPLLCALAVAGSASVLLSQDASWRSTLYPADWTPGFSDAAGHFLHDFSYAGYHRGEKPIPRLAGPVIDVTQAPYQADPTGVKDSTSDIQAALDAAADSDGGVVFLPAGAYRIQPQGTVNHALRIRGDRTVLRGEGADKTFLFNDTPMMRGKVVIELAPEKAMDWRDEGGGILASALARDVPNQAREIFLQSVDGFAAGDLVVLRSDLTQRFIDEVEMTGKWKPAGAGSPNRTLMFCRRIESIDPAKSSVTLDVPVRYPVRVADLGRLVKIPGQLISECGLEDFSIGMKQHPGAGTEEEDFNKPGTVGYDVHGAGAISVQNAENCWIKGVRSYAPAGNAPDIHLLSSGIGLRRSRFVTVEDCSMGFSQYKGGGGNGYLFTHNGQENLIINCRAEAGRHNYDFGTMACSGNVISRSYAKDGSHGSDFHMFLSVSNLLDQMTCDGDFLEARYYRPWGGNPVHGVTTTQSVFWNSKGLKYSKERKALVWSQQVGNGYVIGTSGPCDKVDSDDFVEGVGKGDSLVPASLYQDQLQRRLKAAK